MRCFVGLGLEPSQTFGYVPVEDRGKANPRSILFRFVAERDLRRIEDFFDQAKAAATLRTMADLTLEGLKVAYAGEVALDSLLTRPTIVELRDNLVHELTMNEMDKKKSAWQSLATTDASASPTAPASV
jgi:hypothetical protein